jgi:hypothetical protein
VLRLGGQRRGRQDDEVLTTLDGVERLPPARAHRQLGGALEAEQRLGVTVVEVVDDLPRLQQHVERNHGCAGFQDAEVDEREVGQVGAGQRDLVPLADPARHQQVGHLVGHGVDHRVRQAQVS